MNFKEILDEQLWWHHTRQKKPTYCDFRGDLDTHIFYLGRHHWLLYVVNAEVLVDWQYVLVMLAAAFTPLPVVSEFCCMKICLNVENLLDLYTGCLSLLSKVLLFWTYNVFIPLPKTAGKCCESVDSVIHSKTFWENFKNPFRGMLKENKLLWYLFSFLYQYSFHS